MEGTHVQPSQPGSVDKFSRRMTQLMNIVIYHNGVCRAAPGKASRSANNMQYNIFFVYIFFQLYSLSKWFWWLHIIKSREKNIKS